MNIGEIETFLMIVKTKNITKTAENLFLSQPTVSHRLKVLEEELGIRLVTRKKGHKAVELTQKGEEFVPIAQRWISLWREMQMLKDGKERSVLTLASTDTVNTCILGDFYRKFLLLEPSVDLQLHTHQSYEIYDLVERQEVDAGFVYHRLQYKNIVAKPVLKEKMYLVQYDKQDEGMPLLSKEDERVIINTPQAVHIDELDPDKELYLSWESNYQIWHEQWFGRLIRPHLTIDSYGLIHQFFASGEYWMIAPASIVMALGRQFPVRVSEIANEVAPPERTTFLVRHKNPNGLTQRTIHTFEDHFIRYMSDIPWNII